MRRPNYMKARALLEMQRYIEKARTFSGWSFDELDVRHLDPRMPWNYESLAHEAALRAESIVDLGTGGGERLSRIIEGARGRAVATEQWVVNAPVARDRLGPLGVEVVRADSLRLPFADGAFDLVLDRHEALEPGEVARVLRPGGSVITQQVGHDTWPELRDALPSVQFPDHFRLYQDGFTAAGLVVEEAVRHEERVGFAVLGELVYMIMLTPEMFPEFDPTRDIEAVLDFADKQGTEDGIVMTETHELIRARKPA